MNRTNRFITFVTLIGLLAPYTAPIAAAKTVTSSGSSSQVLPPQTTYEEGEAQSETATAEEEDVGTEVATPIVDESADKDKEKTPPGQDKKEPQPEEPEETDTVTAAATTPADPSTQFQIPTQPKATVDQSTGALLYEYPIELPQGRTGMMPSLSLKYNSRNASKVDTFTGLGWELSIPYIQREPMEGTQNLYTKHYFSSSFSGNLIATTNTASSPYTIYRPESDAGDYLKYKFNSDKSWTVTGKDGRTYTYGATTASRQDNPSNTSQIYKWMLSKITDAHGNEIQYTYIKDSGQIYPSKIIYTYHPSSPAVNTVDFTYTYPTNYGATTYNAAFPVTTKKLLSTIKVTTIADGLTTTDTYNLTYWNESLDIADAQFIKQKLLYSIERITNFAQSSYSQNFSDGTKFYYSTKAPGWEQGTYSLANYNWLNHQGTGTFFKGMYIVDFDLNGYPDVLASDYYSGVTTNNLMMNNGATFTDASSTWALPQNLSSAYAIVDLNGDHLPDLHPRQSPPNGPSVIYFNTGSTFQANTSPQWNMGNYFPDYYCGPNAGDADSSYSNTFLYDINGDSKNDIVHFGGSSTSPDFRVYLNNGNGWATSTAYTFTADPSKSYTYDWSCYGPNEDQNLQTLVDINGDGLSDYVYYRKGTYLNTGSGFAYSAAYSLESDDVSRTGLADINGDNLIDYISFIQDADVSAADNCTRVFFNTGAGFTSVNPPSVANCTYDTGIWYPNALQYTRDSDYWGTLLDVTADGFPDIIGPANGSVTGKVRSINDAKSAWVTNSDTTWKSLITPRYGIYFDINVDGILDFITPVTNWDGVAQAGSKVYMGKPSIPNRLTKVTNPFGAQTNVAYGTAPTNLSDVNVAPMPVVKKLSVQNIGQGQPDMVTQYEYEGGAYVIDPATKQKRFAGFQKVTATESGADLVPLRVTETYFHQANGSDSATNEPEDAHLALIGRPYYSVLENPAGNLKRESWVRYGASTFVTEPVVGRVSQFVYPTQSVSKITDSSGSFARAEEYAYDATLGERTEFRQLGFVNAGSGGSYTDISGDERYTITEYAANSTKTIVKPKRVELRSSPSQSDTISRTDLYYDNQSYGFLGSYGDLTKETSWISGNGAVTATTTYAYDAFGNILSVTNPRLYTTTYAYDSTKTLVASVTNPLNQTISYQYVTGKLKKVTDPNGRAVTYGYSNKGWLYSTTATNTGGTQIIKQYLDQSSGYLGIYTQSQLVNTRYDYSVQSLDNLGRPVRFARQQLNHSTNIRGSWYLKAAKMHDALGRVISVGAPYGTSGTSWTALMTVTLPTSLVITTTYDVFDRPTSVKNALGTTNFAYAGQSTTVTDANGKKKGTKTDAYGNLVEVKEYYTTSGAYTTLYAYDSRNLLTKITDALGNVRNFTYNNAGWLTSSEDLHTPSDTNFSVSTFTYDANGNLLTETEPIGVVVTRAYDALDRATSIDASNTSSTDHTITYDTCTNGKGRVCSVSGILPDSVTFTRSYVYGISGAPTSVSLNTQGATSTVSYQYTVADTVSKITHPNNTVVRYTFGDWALPSNAYLTLPGGAEANYATSTYTFFYKPATTTIASGLTISHTYDDAKLYRESLMSATFGTSTLQSYAYTYDNVNNITKIIEPSVTKVYTYDNLYRLTKAVHTPTSGSATTYTYAYNAIGNVTSANGASYTYGGAGKTNPHAVTSVGANSYAYNANGNMISAPGMTIAYNFQNQPYSFTLGAGITKAYYDESGTRFVYKTPASTEVRVTDDYLLRGSIPEITLKLGEMLLGVVSNNVVYASVSDHLGTPVKQVASGGTVAESVAYDPFGKVTSQTGSLNTKKGYTGHDEDLDTGLVYAKARYYSPTSLRFAQQDPILKAPPAKLLADPQQLNSYSYVRNNPIGGTDPDGLLTLVDPGTWYHQSSRQTQREWEESAETQAMLKRVGDTFNETAQIFHWSANDNSGSQMTAAEGLAQYINNYSFKEGEKLNIVAHSHGGTNALESTPLLHHDIDTLVTLGMPGRNDYGVDRSRIKQQIQLYSNWDAVQLFAGNNIETSALIGLAAGSYFGPYGAMAGLFVGTGFGYGEFGLTGRTIDGATNIAVPRSDFQNKSLPSVLWKSHSELLWNDAIWNKYVIGNLR